MRRGPRWFHHLYANLGGYFWMPCEVCGRMHGGHEAHWPRFGHAVCSEECAARHDPDGCHWCIRQERERKLRLFHDRIVADMPNVDGMGGWRVQVTELPDPGDVWMNPPGAACVEASCDWTVEDVDTFEQAREALHDHWRTCEHRDREERTDV